MVWFWSMALAVGMARSGWSSVLGTFEGDFDASTGASRVGVLGLATGHGAGDGTELVEIGTGDVAGAPPFMALSAVVCFSGTHGMDCFRAGGLVQ